MASPGDKKGQRKGSCGHIMAAFDLHEKCARCRDKRIVEDNCVLDKPCPICDGFSDAQRELLATPSYRIRKDKKAGLLVSPKEVTVISSVDTEPTFQSPSGPSAQPPAHSPTMASSSSTVQPSGFVTSEQFIAMSDKWTEQFARMEALLSHGNIFSTPVSAVKPVDSQQLISETPFLAPATRPTGPMKVPVAVDTPAKVSTEDHKGKKKSHRSRKDESSHRDSSGTEKQSGKKRDSKIHKKRDRSQSPAPKKSVTKQVKYVPPPADPSSRPESADQHGTFKLDIDRPSTGQEKVHADPSGQSSSVPYQPVTGQFSTGAGAYPLDAQDTLFEQISEDDFDRSDSFSGSDDGQLSDSAETPEQTEDMTYRETVRSVRSFMGWHHIPTSESDFAEPDRSNNTWKGKQPRKPTRISVAMPPDDWLCQKLEHLNLTVAEGYPSRAQDSAGLRRD